MSFFSSRSFVSAAVFGLALGIAGGVVSDSAHAGVVRHGAVATPNGTVHRTKAASSRGAVNHTRVTTPNGQVYRHTTVVDRGQPGWWHGHGAFVGYTGARAGYYYAPGYGYYAIPRGYAHTTWVVGVTLPPPMRSYVVIQPATFGLSVPPPGYNWYYAGTNFVLVSVKTGVIVRSVAGGW
jgi:Ni/Co efflux regulator RcnB